VPERYKPQAASRKPRRAQSAVWPLVAVGAAFVLSRIGHYVAGVRFDASSLPWFWQFIDPALLKASLGQSLWYLHSQPPAFNLFLGIIVNLFPGHETAAFTSCYLLLGLVFAVTLFLLLRSFGLPDTLNVALTTIYVASPACVLYENWLFYTYPMTVVLLLATLFWHRFVSRGRFLDALALFVAAAVLAMTWSLFHLVWLLGLVLALVLAARKRGQSLGAAASNSLRDSPRFRQVAAEFAQALRLVEVGAHAFNPGYLLLFLDQRFEAALEVGFDKEPRIAQARLGRLFVPAAHRCGIAAGRVGDGDEAGEEGCLARDKLPKTGDSPPERLRRTRRGTVPVFARAGTVLLHGEAALMLLECCGQYLGG